MSIELTKKFIEGLKNYNLTYLDIVNNNFHYCGGNNERHLNYYKLCFNNKELPEKIDKCICGHKISENCYITDGKIILTLGNCCIKKFLPKDKSGRTCEKCGKSHKNRKVNLCNNCKNGYGKIYINVCYAEKDDAKTKGARWDSEKKQWYIYENNSNKEEILKKYKLSVI
jgi:hypothetical protein